MSIPSNDPPPFPSSLNGPPAPAPLPVFAGRHSYFRSAPETGTTSHRRLVVCFDGTGNVYGTNITNIPTLFSLLSEDPSKCIPYYQTGIGTTISTHESVWMPGKIVEKIGLALDAGVAWSLGSHICKGYQFLMNHWQPGDRIYIFGFSRGAFTARALAGMLQQVGLLPAGNEESVPLAYSIYKKKETKLTDTETLAEGYKRTFSRDVRVEFVGVFDTVSSVGALIPRTLPFAAGTNYIHHFRHACALDECRARYNPQPWVDDDPSCPTGACDEHPSTSIKEVWFAGAHSNCGGGEFPYGPDGDAKPSLSHLPLRWMLREAVEHGLELDTARVASSPLFSAFWAAAGKALEAREGGSMPEKLAAYLKSAKDRNPDLNEQVAACVFFAAMPSAQATRDALAPRANHVSFEIQKRPEEVRRKMGWGARLGDWASRVQQRAVTLGWWILEVSPTLKVVWDQEGNRRKFKIRANWGRGRTLPRSPSFHFSVLERLNATAFGPGNNENVPEGKSYKPLAHFRKGEGMQNVVWAE
ncbi:hypothetical protein JCM10207_003543 [Rhodosporidiobolus poonsookiae]